MRVAALFDIHGNLPALEAVLGELECEPVDVILAGGDIAGGPWPGETLDRLAALGSSVVGIRGNGERDMADAYEKLAAGALAEAALREPTGEVWAAMHLTAAHREWLAGLATSRRVAIEGLGEVEFCHASPRSDEELITAESDPELVAESLSASPAAVVVAGHTHVQFDRTFAGRRLINAGSVGMPYEDAPGAYWALLGPGVELRRTVYDHVQAGAAIRCTGYPGAEEMTNDCLLEPLGADAATAHFERLGRSRREAIERFHALGR